MGYARRRSANLSSADLPANISPRPDSYYGVSKAAMEALGSYFADEFGLKTTSPSHRVEFSRAYDVAAAVDLAERIGYFPEDDAEKYAEGMTPEASDFAGGSVPPYMWDMLDAVSSEAG